MLHLAHDKNQNAIYLSSEHFMDARCYPACCSAWAEASLGFSLLEMAKAAHSCTYTFGPFLATDPHLYCVVLDGAIVTRVSKNQQAYKHSPYRCVVCLLG